MSDDDYPLDPGAYTPHHAYIHHRPADARQAILDLTRERDEARAKVERLREALRWIVTVNALDYEYQARARKALEGAP